MEGRRDKILQAIILCLCTVAFLEELTWGFSIVCLQYWEDMCCILIDSLDGRSFRDSHLIWSYNRPSSFMERTLLRSYTDEMFKRRLRLSKATFHYVCHTLGPILVRADTSMRLAIPVEKRVCIALCRLATGDTIREIADMYGVGYTTAQRAISEFCRAVKIRLHDLCIKWPSNDRLEILSKGFEKVRGIPHVVGAIDGSHLPIIAPHENAQDYYNRKGFHSVLLQLIVSSDCCIWDYDVGWAGSIHDWKLFEQTEAGRRIKAGHLGNYCLVGDAAYPPRPWMLPPFKGHRDGLSRQQYHWNFIQSSTRMAVERAFGMLKSRFRILLKRNDTKLDSIPEIVATCLVLHNLCIKHGEKFDSSWVEEAKLELHKAIESERMTKQYASRIKRLNIPETEVTRAASYGLHRVNGLNLNPMEALARALEDDNEAVASLIQKAPKTTVAISAANSTRRNALAAALYKKQSIELVREQFGEGDTETSEED